MILDAKNPYTMPGMLINFISNPSKQQQQQQQCNSGSNKPYIESE
jgi:hypothetical protein